VAKWKPPVTNTISRSDNAKISKPGLKLKVRDLNKAQSSALTPGPTPTPPAIPPPVEDIQPVRKMLTLKLSVKRDEN